MPDPVWGTEGSAPEPVRKQPPPVAEPHAPNERHEPAAPFDLPDPPPLVLPDPPPRGRADDSVPDWLRSTRDPDAVPADRDPVAVVAVACGFVGIVVFGLLFAVVTAVLGAWAGQRARDSGRTYELPFLAFGLAVVDGIVWLTLQSLFELPQWLG